MALALVVAYEMYCECVEEGYASFGFETKEEATINCMLNFVAFRSKMALQGLHYHPEELKYPGDEEMRVNTKRGKRKLGPNKEGERRGRGRPRKNVTPDVGVGDAANAIVEGKVTLAQLKQAKKVGGRLCGDLTMFQIHKESIETKKYELSCKFCGKLCYTRCGVCQLPCHDAPTRGSCKGYQCFTQLHNEQLFGLAIMDCKLINKDKNDWTPPTPQQKEENAKHVKEIQRKVAYNLRGRAAVPDSI